MSTDAYIGLKESELGRISELKVPDMKGVMLQSMLPKFMGRRFEQNLFDIVGVMRQFASGPKRTPSEK